MTITAPTAYAIDRPHQTLNMNRRIGGAAGMAFVVLAAFQNLIRAAFAPTMSASDAQIIDHYQHHQAALTATVWMFAIAGVCLAMVIAALWQHVEPVSNRLWIRVGAIGAIATCAIFPIVVAFDAALLILTTNAAGDTTNLKILWVVHNTIFTINSLALSVALLGLSIATTKAKLTPRPFRVIGPTGAVLLALAAATTPQIAGGNAQALYSAMGVGYLTWLAYLTTASFGLLRTHP